MNSHNISIAFVGDMSFGDSPICQGFGVRSFIKQNGKEFLFAEVRDILKNNDMLFGNLETVLSRQGENPGSLASVQLRGEPEYAGAVKTAGFHVLNMANNHSMQHGLAPFRETVELLRSSNIEIAGLKGEHPWHSQPVILQKNTINIGFIGYAFEADRYYTEELPYAFGRDRFIAEDIERLRPLVDILIVSNHWGVETMDRPSVATIRLARHMVDLGADIVIGHHPHTLQGIEQYKGKIIAYSLGNFIFDMGWDIRYRESIVLKIHYDLSQKELRYEIVPIIIGLNCQPSPLHAEEARALLDRMAHLSSKLTAEMEGTVEYNSLRYYNEFQKNRKMGRIQAYRYFISHFGRYKKKFILDQVAMTLRSRLEDLGLHKNA